MAARSRRGGGSGESKDPVQQTLAGLVKSRRSYRGLTQAVLSTKAGLPRNAVGDFERGNRRVDGEELVKLCIELGVSVDDFLEEFKGELTKSLRPIEQRLREQRAGQTPDRESRTVEPVAEDEYGFPPLPEDPAVLVLAVQVARAGGKDLETTIRTVVRALHRYPADLEEPSGGGTSPGRKR
jgi:transcriptional regulator with XRE-family HTH domain